MFALFYIIQFATATVKRNIKKGTYENDESAIEAIEWIGVNIVTKNFEIAYKLSRITNIKHCYKR